MDNKLIQTNGLWYRIKKFLKNLLLRAKPNKIREEENEINNCTNNRILSENFEQENRKKKIAERLILGELDISELNETELDEMIEYFIKDIQNIDSKLAVIKEHIIDMQKELKNIR